MKEKPSILLINPWIFDFSAYDLWLKPLGLLIVANWLKLHFNVHFIDCLDRHDPALAGNLYGKTLRHMQDNEYGTGKFPYVFIPKPDVFSWMPRRYKQYGIPEELFLKKLRQLGKIDAVGITTVMTYWYPGMQRAIELVRRELGNVPVILGGIYARLCREHALKTSGADFVTDACTEKEILGEFCKALRHAPVEASTGGLTPDYSHYANLKTAATVTQTGCPFRCTYCASHLLYEKISFRPHDEIFREFLGYYERGVKDVAFYDDSLLVNFRNRLEPVLDRLVREGIRLRFHTPNAIHAREVTPHTAKKLRGAGFETIRIGFESASPSRQADSSNGKVTNEHLLQCVENLKTAGFDMNNVGCYIMAGLPGQTAEEIKETVRFVHKTGIRISVSMFSPVPGTPEYARCVAEYGLDPAEPLMTNKTAYGLREAGRRYEELEQTRRLAVELMGKR